MQIRIRNLFECVYGNCLSRKRFWIFSLLWSCIFIIVIPVKVQGALIGQIFGYGSIFLLFFFLVHSLVLFSLKYHSNLSAVNIFFRKRQVAFITFIISTVILSCYFILFYPGLVSWDFYVQWFQITERLPYSDWHPIFHTLLIWIVTRVWLSPAIVVVCQIVAFSFLLVMTLKRLEGVGSSKVFLIFLGGFYVFFPLNGFYMVSLWKDIAYGLSLWWYTLLVVDVIYSKGEILRRYTFLLQFLIAMVFVSFIRHNGIVPALGTFLILLFLFKKERIRFLLIFVVFFTFIFFYKNFIFSNLDVDVSEKNILKAHLPVQHIGYILNNEGIFTVEEKEYLNTICSLDYWKKAFSYSSCMPLIFGKNENGENYLNGSKLKSGKEFSEFLETWKTLVFRHPFMIAQYHLLASEFLWKINSKIGVFVIPDEGLAAEHLKSGYTPSNPPLFDRVSPPAQFLIKLLKNNETAWFLYRGAFFFWMVLFFITLSYLCERNILAVTIAATPLLFQSLTLFAFPLVQDTRFYYSIFLIAPVVVALFFSRNDKKIS